MNEIFITYPETENPDTENILTFLPLPVRRFFYMEKNHERKSAYFK